MLEAYDFQFCEIISRVICKVPSTWFLMPRSLNSRAASVTIRAIMRGPRHTLISHARICLQVLWNHPPCDKPKPGLRYQDHSYFNEPCFPQFAFKLIGSKGITIKVKQIGIGSSCGRLLSPVNQFYKVVVKLMQMFPQSQLRSNFDAACQHLCTWPCAMLCMVIWQVFIIAKVLRCVKRNYLTQWWYFFIIFEYILHISTPHIMIFCFPLPYFPLSTSALFFA